MKIANKVTIMTALALTLAATSVTALGAGYDITNNKITDNSTGTGNCITVLVTKVTEDGSTGDVVYVNQYPETENEADFLLKEGLDAGKYVMYIYNGSEKTEKTFYVGDSNQVLGFYAKDAEYSHALESMPSEEAGAIGFVYNGPVSLSSIGGYIVKDNSDRYTYKSISQTITGEGNACIALKITGSNDTITEAYITALSGTEDEANE